ncbi:AbfB domain-containing protein [Streptomyces sp. NBC_01017]|uniref:AbfB domain-containing protein n=1 Tax=Streptomyces sp. NBC_01017 TaxID=2903721 RepID=UPI00386F1F8F
MPFPSAFRLAARQGREGQNPWASAWGASQSFESRNYPGGYLRHYNVELRLATRVVPNLGQPHPLHGGHTDRGGPMAAVTGG